MIELPTMRHVIFRDIPTSDPAMIAAASAFSVADLHEAMPAARARSALMASRVRPVVAGLKILGFAVTSCDGEGNNLMMHKALSLAPRGSVLVATSFGRRGALWGELAAGYARRAGVAGVIVDGNVRDVADLQTMRFPTWASEISPLRSDKDKAGAVNVPIMCGDILVRPGDIVAADADGVLVIQPAEMASVVERAAVRKARENELRQSIETGGSLFEELRLEETIEALGMEQVDGHWRREG